MSSMSCTAPPLLQCDDHDNDCHKSCHDDDEDKCEKKYIRRCYYKHNHKKVR